MQGKPSWKLKSSKKVWIVLRSSVRTYADEGFVTGNSVYYKRQNCKGWYGSTKVLGKEGQCVLIRHFTEYIRVMW